MSSNTSQAQKYAFLPGTFPRESIFNMISAVVAEIAVTQHHTLTLEERMEVLETQVTKLNEEKSLSESLLYNEGDAIYDLHQLELEKQHMGKIVAIDLVTEKPAGFGKTIRSAYLDAMINYPERDKFYFRKIGKRYLTKL